MLESQVKYRKLSHLYHQSAKLRFFIKSKKFGDVCKLSNDFNLSPGQTRNIVSETLCFLPMFPCLPTLENIVPGTKLASQEAKMFPKKFRNIFVAQTMFPSEPTRFQMFPARETLFSRVNKFKKCFKTIVQI